MNPVDLDSLAIVARQLDRLSMNYAFTGGSALGFLLDHPDLPFPRQTNDVDAIVEVVTRSQHSRLEDQLRTLNFSHDITDGAPACRWVFDGIKTDIMPVRDSSGHFSDAWFEYALQTSGPRTLMDTTVRTVSPACFVATKLTAFGDRGGMDFYASHDLEDIVTVVDGRKALIDELREERADLRAFISTTIQKLIQQPGFMDCLPGHLPSDEASQRRLPLVLERLHQIAALK